MNGVRRREGRGEATTAGVVGAAAAASVWPELSASLDFIINAASGGPKEKKQAQDVLERERDRLTTTAAGEGPRRSGLPMGTRRAQELLSCLLLCRLRCWFGLSASLPRTELSIGFAISRGRLHDVGLHVHTAQDFGQFQALLKSLRLGNTENTAAAGNWRN